MAEQKRENDGGQTKAFQPQPGGDAHEDALGYAEAIIVTVREPLVVLEADLRVRTANRSFYRTFRVRPEGQGTDGDHRLGQEGDERRATQAGFDPHLTKPVDPAELQELLARSGSPT
jgi:hypothetical protein